MRIDARVAEMGVDRVLQDFIQVMLHPVRERVHQFPRYIERFGEEQLQQSMVVQNLQGNHYVFRRQFNILIFVVHQQSGVSQALGHA